MKTLMFKLTLFALILGPNARADRAGGGGGKKEPLFEEIATNIHDWIKSGRADEIANILPSDVTLPEYKSEMLQVLGNYHIAFTDDKVYVNKKEKTCRGYVDEEKVNQIICNNGQFGSDTPDNISEIYRQVHHEFAGLACRKIESTGSEVCLEENRNENSDYRISNYISAHLEPQMRMRLPVLSDSVITGTQLMVWSENFLAQVPQSVGAKFPNFQNTIAIRDLRGHLANDPTKACGFHVNQSVFGYFFYELRSAWPGFAGRTAGVADVQFVYYVGSQNTRGISFGDRPRQARGTIVIQLEHSDSISVSPRKMFGTDSNGESFVCVFGP